jgi:hypothetical protein
MLEDSWVPAHTQQDIEAHREVVRTLAPPPTFCLEPRDWSGRRAEPTCALVNPEFEPPSPAIDPGPDVEPKPITAARACQIRRLGGFRTGVHAWPTPESLTLVGQPPDGGGLPPPLPGIKKPQFPPGTLSPDDLSPAPEPNKAPSTAEADANAQMMGSLFPLPTPNALNVDTSALNYVDDLAMTKAYERLYVAWVALCWIAECSERMIVQWWNEHESSVGPANYLHRYVREQDDGESSLFRLLRGVTLGLARIAGGKFEGNPVPALTAKYEPCSNIDNACQVDGQDFLLCLPQSLSIGERVEAILSGLVSGPSGMVNTGSRIPWDEDPPSIMDLEAEEIFALAKQRNADNVAKWLHQRFAPLDAQLGWHRATLMEDDDWDRRPDRSYAMQWDLVFAYKTGNNEPGQLLSQLEWAWEQSFRWTEAAWRFIYRLSILARIHGPQAVEDMWNFGGRYQSVSGDLIARRVRNPRNTSISEFYYFDGDCNSFRNEFRCSMRDYFGPYSPSSVATVYWVITALLLRYQGKYWRPSSNNWRYWTRFYILQNIAGRPYSYTNGIIVLPKGYWHNTSTIYRCETLPHEMLHYLVRLGEGGRPRDKWSPYCYDGDNHKCYNNRDAVNLGSNDPGEALSNNDNYVFWIKERYRRWCGDWPPETDIRPEHPEEISAQWWNDPIPDSNWAEHFIGSDIGQDSAFDLVRDFQEDIGLAHDWEPWDEIT